MLAFSSMSNSLSHKRGEDDARGVGARQRRVEHVGIVAQPDAQMALGEGAAGGQAQGEGHATRGLSVSWSVSVGLRSEVI